MNNLRISRVKFAWLLLTGGQILFVISSIGALYDHPSIRLPLLLIRLALAGGLLVVVRSFLKVNLTELSIIILGTITFLTAHDIFILEAITGLLIAKAWLNIDPKLQLLGAVSKYIMVALVLIMILSRFGILEAKHVLFRGYANAINVSISDYKYNWSFWQPNVMGYLMFGCLLTAFYCRLRLQFAISLILFAILANFGVSRTYLACAILVLLYWLAEIIWRRASKVLSAILAFGATIAIAMSTLFIVPSIMNWIAGSGFATVLNVILSGRIDIAAQITHNMDLLQFLFGIRYPMNRPDSLYLSIFYTQGLFVFVPFLVFALYIVMRAARRGAQRELLVITLVAIAGNFENIADIGSLFWLVTGISFYLIFRRPAKRSEAARYGNQTFVPKGACFD